MHGIAQNERRIGRILLVFAKKVAAFHPETEPVECVVTHRSPHDALTVQIAHHFLLRNRPAAAERDFPGLFHRSLDSDAAQNEDRCTPKALSIHEILLGVWIHETDSISRMNTCL